MGRTPLRRLVGDEDGMTLMELLSVIIILAVLLAIAVPSYLGLKDRTYQNAAKSNLRNVLPAVGAYGLDNSPGSRDDPDLPAATDAGFDGVTPTLLEQKYDPTLNASVYHATGNSTTYCIYTWVNAWTAYQVGPGGDIKVKLSSDFSPSLDCA